MFSGIITQCGIIRNIEKHAEQQRLWISADFTDLVLGESIAIDGICLTVTAIDKTDFCVAVSPETLHVTNARFFAIDKRVNLERALCIGDRLGGHFVLGHVDTTAQLLDKKTQGDFISYQFGQFPQTHQIYLISKGSIAINGVSLTLNAIGTQNFSVMLIPHTLENTNLAALEIGQYVNIEFDYLAKILHEQSKHPAIYQEEY